MGPDGTNCEEDTHGGPAFLQLVDIGDDARADGHTARRAECLNDPEYHQLRH